MQLHKLLRPRDVLPTENQTIAELSEEKCPEWAKFPDILWIETLWLESEGFQFKPH